MHEPFPVLAEAVASVTDPTDRAQLVAALALIDPGEFAVKPTLDAAPGVLAQGVAASPGQATGVVATSATEVLALVDAGRSAVLFVEETTPGDNAAIVRCSAVVTRSGGLASHAAIMARQLAIPAVCGVSNGLSRGLVVRVDGGTGCIEAAAEVDGLATEDDEGAVPAAERLLLEWWDDLGGIEAERPSLAVHANADSPAQVKAALEAGASAVGLCRSEHQLSGEALGALRRLVGLETSPAGGDLPRDDAGADRAEQVLEDSFLERNREILDAAGGLPVTLRLLDAPSHEFDLGFRETNPMLGMRGARFLLGHERVARAQIRSTVRAGAESRSAIEILIPFVTHPAQLTVLADWIGEETARFSAEGSVTIAAMVETPAAALEAAQLCAVVPSLSFGTNDMVQLVRAESRDDITTGREAQRGGDGGEVDEPVRRLMEIAAHDARRVNDDVVMSLCGESASGIDGLRLARRLGFGSVSVAPSVVARVRLLVAHLDALDEMESRN